jgi:hypothetical protein
MCAERERPKGTTSTQRIIAAAAENKNEAWGCVPMTSDRSFTHACVVYPEQDSHSSDLIIRRGKWQDGM